MSVFVKCSSPFLVSMQQFAALAEPRRASNEDRRNPVALGGHALVAWLLALTVSAGEALGLAVARIGPRVSRTVAGVRFRALAFRADGVAAVQISGIITGVLITVVGIVGAVVAVNVLADLLPTYFTALKNIVVAFKIVNATGDPTTDAVLPFFATLVALAGTFGIIVAALAAVAIKTSQRRGAAA